jgi:hypothetical protein
VAVAAPLAASAFATSHRRLARLLPAAYLLDILRPTIVNYLVLLSPWLNSGVRCIYTLVRSPTLVNSVPMALGKVGVFQCRQVGNLLLMYYTSAPNAMTPVQCMTVVGDTVALLLTREGGGTEQVLGSVCQLCSSRRSQQHRRALC